MATPTIAKSVLTDRNSSYKSQDVIEIYIAPEDVPLLNPNETYIKFVVQMNLGSGTAADPFVLAQPDERAGAHSLIREVQIYDGQNQQLLEQLENYNNWTAQKFHYDKTPGLDNLRALMEGQSRKQGNNMTSLYFSGNALANPQVKPVEVCMPLHMSGILQGSKVFPVILTSGLRIRITLADNAQCLKAFTQVGVATNTAPAVGAASAANENPIPTQDNILTSFNTNGAFFESNVAIAAGNITTLTLKSAGATAPNINATNDNVPFRKGQVVGFEINGAGANAGKIFNCGVITDITNPAGQVVLTFAQVAVAAADAAVAGAKIFVYADDNFQNAPKYEVRNVDMVCSVVQAQQSVIDGMVRKVNSGSVKLDYSTYNIYRNNLNARVNRPNINFQTTERRAKSIMSFPMGTSNSVLLSNFRPVRGGMLNYQYNIANRLTPNRRVDVARVAQQPNNTPVYEWNAIHQHELEKALGRWKVPPRFLARNSEAFAVARELAKVGHSFNANSQEIILNMEYSTAADANTEEKLLDTWVYHIRTLVISPSSIAVEY